MQNNPVSRGVAITGRPAIDGAFHRSPRFNEVVLNRAAACLSSVHIALDVARPPDSDAVAAGCSTGIGEAPVDPAVHCSVDDDAIVARFVVKGAVPSSVDVASYRYILLDGHGITGDFAPGRLGDPAVNIAGNSSPDSNAVAGKGAGRKQAVCFVCSRGGCQRPPV